MTQRTISRRIPIPPQRTRRSTKRPPEPEILKIAERLSRVGERARFLKRNNTAGAWVSLPDAVASGRPFMITVRDDILVLDVDTAAQRSTLDKVIRRLHRWGVEPVVVASGQEGHRHLFAWIGSPDHLTYLRRMARAAGIDVRPSGHIRPPLSPHRLGYLPSLISPTTRAEALTALTSAPDDWAEPPARAVGSGGSTPAYGSVPPAAGPLSLRMQALVRDGGTNGDYRSRSEVEMAVLTAMALSGWGFEHVTVALLDPGNAAGDRLREKVEVVGENRALRSLERSFGKAMDLINANPAISASVLAALRDHAETWTGRTAQTDFLVYSKILDHAEQAHNFHVNVSIRQLVEETGRARGTVTKSLQRLRQQYLSLVEVGVGTQASVYRIIADQEGGDPDACNDPPSSHPHILMLGGSIANPAHDVWANRSGLGAYAYRTYREILDHPKSVETLVGSANCGREKTIRKHLRVMHGCGLVTVDDAGLWRGQAVSATYADQIARELGTAGRGQRLHETHQRERAAYARLAKPRKLSGSWGNIKK